MLPTSLALLAATRVGFTRVEEYLLLPEHATEEEAPPLPSGVLAKLGDESEPCSFEWPGTDWRLRGVALTVRAGAVVAVTGTIGAGKTSLLCALLGEMPPLPEQAGRSRRAVTSSLCFLGQCASPLLAAGVRWLTRCCVGQAGVCDVWHRA